MKIRFASDPGSAEKPNEDWFYASPELIVVLDGATARTDTGCRHGVAWYSQHLGETIVKLVGKYSLVEVLAEAIKTVAALHPECDLASPGTPSAAVGIIQLGDEIEHLVLGDVSLIFDTVGGVKVITDPRVSSTGEPARSQAESWPLDAPERAPLVLQMKASELAARNVPDGYWIAAADPEAAEHALTGAVALGDVRRVSVLSDGAASAVDRYGLMNWQTALDALAGPGPDWIIEQIRTAEAEDPNAVRWRRMKRADDATVVFMDLRAADADGGRVGKTRPLLAKP
jgi:hypothetical protein